MPQNTIELLGSWSELFGIIQDLLVLDAGQIEDFGLFERSLSKIAPVKKICVVALFQGEEDEFFCSDSDCPRCGGRDAVVAFARRMTGITSAVLEGEELKALMSDEEKKWFQFESPMFVPLFADGEPIGAVWCHLSDSITPVQKERLAMACRMMCVAFRNRFYYKSAMVHENTLTLILENLDANIYITSIEDDRILFINKKMREEFDIGMDAIGNRCWEYLQTGITGRCEFCPCNLLQENPDVPVVWEEHNTKTGKFYKNTDSIIEWLDGSSVHLQHSVDVTEEKNIQQSLMEAKRVADLASKAKGDFLSRMSHEIRTPLNAIIGMARIGMITSDFDKMQECIRKIDSSSNQLLGLINDVLDMSKIEASKMELTSEVFDFEKMLIDISNVICVKSEEKLQKLHIHMNMDMPRFYNGDEVRISQIITNLLSNAVKFTPECGTVRMDVREKSRDGAYSIVEVRVSDTGIGIPKEQQSTLFTAFEQADGGIARRFGGTGLGLAISKSIVEMMNGQIFVESEPDKGSTFMFTIRLERVDSMQSPRKAFKDVDFSSLRAILCDSSAETREYFSQIMESFHIEADVVPNMDECLKMLDRGNSQESPYHLVFLDWNIPDMDGGVLCRMLKERYGSCIIVLISTTQWSEIKTQAEHYGVNKFLPKPIFPSMLFNVINESVGLPGKFVEAVQSTRYLFAGCRVIVAEDVEINREVICMALEDTKVKIVPAENGKVATELFEASPHSYDLILMDVNMPVMDGYEATKYIRSLNMRWAKEIPILAMTANAFAEDIEKSLACGMNDHLTKPVNFDLLFSKLQQYLIDRKLTAATERTGGVLMQDPLANNTEFLIHGLDDYINVADALARVRGNRKIYKTLLQSFVNNSRINELKEEIQSGNLDAAAKTAHSIKGASANLSLIAVSESAARLESQLKTGSYDTETLRECVSGFEKTKELIGELMAQL